MKRNINRENWARIENRYVQRTWTFSTKETDETPKSFDYWYIKNNRRVIEAASTQDNDIITVESFIKQYNEVLNPVPYYKNWNWFAIRDTIELILPPGTYYGTSKALVLLNEAGSGKTTYLTWLAHELFQGHSTRWIVMLKLIECSFVFSEYEQEKEIEQRLAALRLLYQLMHMAFLAPSVNSKDMEYARNVYQDAKNGAEVLKISNGCVVLDAAKIELVMNVGYKSPATCRMLVLLRILRNKFNRHQLYLLMDGFDEIAPIYMETAIPLLSEINCFKGIYKLYLTSRPYGFRQNFEEVLKTCTFFRLSKFSKDDILQYTHRFVSNKWSNLCEENRMNLVRVFNILARWGLGDMTEIPLFLAIGLESLQNVVEKYFDFEASLITPGLWQECQNMFEPMRMMENFVMKKLNINNLDKPSANVGMITTSVAVMMRAAAYEKTLQMHSILAMYLVFEERTVKTLLPESMRNEAVQYMENVRNGSEKSGIIEGVLSNKPIFIHRLFAEYFAARWLLSNKDLPGVKEFVKTLMYGRDRKRQKEVRYFLNRLICKGFPLHMAILDRSIGKIEELLKTNKEYINDKDVCGRTPLHLAFGECWEGEDLSFYKEGLKLLVETADPKNIYAIDDYFDWSAIFFVHIDFQRSLALEYVKIKTPLSAEDPVEIFLYSLRAANHLEYTFAKNVLLYFLKCIARKLIDEKHFDLHSALVIKEFERKGNTRMLHKILNWFPYARAFHTPLDYCVRFDSLMLEVLVDAAGGPEKVLSTVAPRLLHLACKRRSYKALSYLIIDCKFQLPSIKHFDHVIICLLVCMFGDKQMFKDLYHKYCKQYNIPCVDEDQLREQEMLDENHQNTFDAFRTLDRLKSVGFPTQKYVLENGIDTGTYFLLDMAWTHENATILNYLIRKTGIANEIEVIAALLSNLNQFTDRWSCSFHFLLENTTNFQEGVQKNGQNLLHIACTKGWFDLVKCLIEHFNFSALRENEKENNWNAFFYCVQDREYKASSVEQNLSGKIKIFTYLLGKYSMDWFGKLDSKGCSVFYYAVKNNRKFEESILRKEFDTELKYVSFEHKTRLTRQLCSSGFDVDEILEYLAKNDVLDAISIKTVCSTLKISEGFIFGDEGRNLLHIACTKRLDCLVRCLIEHCKFDPLRENERENNWNAFFYCVQGNQNFGMFLYLMEQFNMDCFGKRDSKGKSVFDYALKGDVKKACCIMYKEFQVKGLKSIPKRSACLLTRLQEADVTKEYFRVLLERAISIEYRSNYVQPMLEIL